MSKFFSRTYLIPLLILAALVFAGCTQAVPTAPADDEPAAEEPAEGEPAEEEAAAQPGEGQTLQVGVPTWDTGYFQSWVVFMLAEELGYEIDEPQVLENPIFYTSLAQGDVDFWADGWMPLHETFVEPVSEDVTIAGVLVEAGALEGYLVDMATAEEYDITSLEDFQDPEIASLFDNDGDGLADLTGCNPGWGCEEVIEHHLDAYELRDAITHVQGTYSALMADTIARYEAGEPIFFYTWTPNWTVAELVPGEDVVWIEVPFSSLPEAQVQFEDATTLEGVTGCVSDPCNMGFPGNDLVIAANSEWLNENPALANLFDNFSLPLEDIISQNAEMAEGEDSIEDIQADAEQWIEENRDQVDQWLEEARAAAQQ